MSGDGRALTAEEIEAYRRDGVVCLRGVLNDEWVELVREAVDTAEQRHRELQEQLATQNGRSEWTRDQSSLHALGTFGDTLEESGQTVLRDGDGPGGDGEFILVNNSAFDCPAVRRLALEGPLGSVSGQLFGSTKVNFLFDQIFIKQPGANARTAFHQDQPYFAVDGEQVASLWTAAEPVARESGGMGYIRGSHLWDMHAPNVFVGQASRGEHGLPLLPDIEGHESDYDIVYYDVEPGDVIVHDYRTVHGARGNTTSDRPRRAISLRFAGDDATVLRRPSAAEEFPDDPALSDGDPLDGDAFPVVWRRS